MFSSCRRWCQYYKHSEKLFTPILGVFLQITEIPQNWLQYNPLATSSSYYNASTQILDLAKLVGFSKEPVKLFLNIF